MGLPRCPKRQGKWASPTSGVEYCILLNIIRQGLLRAGWSFRAEIMAMIKRQIERGVTTASGSGAAVSGRPQWTHL